MEWHLCSTQLRTGDKCAENFFLTMSHERRLQSRRNERDAACLFKSLTLRVQHQQMEPHNHISIIPFPFSLLSHAMLLLHVKKQSQIALDAHLFPIPVTWQRTGPAGLSPQQGIGCYQLLRFGGAPSLTRPLPWPRNFHYCTKAWMLLAMFQECYGMVQK